MYMKNLKLGTKLVVMGILTGILGIMAGYSISEIYNGESMLSYFIVIAAVILIFAVIASIKNSIVTPLKKLKILLKDISKGNTDLKIGATINDEIGELVVSLRDMVNNVNEVKKVEDDIIKAIASGKLRKLLLKHIKTTDINTKILLNKHKKPY